MFRRKTLSFYWLSFYWRDSLPNYRRFFEINDLVGLRVEDTEVFDATHELALRLLADKRIDGLRIDHVDGLRDPLVYLRRLRERAGDDAYIVVEKILADGETLPSDWPIDGTTGYDFLGQANAVFVDGTGLRGLTQTYRRFATDATPLADTLYRRKRSILQARFQRELRWLSQSFARIDGIDESQAREAVLELTSCLPVYRTYINADGVSDADATYLAQAAGRAIADVDDPSAIERLHDLILSAPTSRPDLSSLPTPPKSSPTNPVPDALEFVLRWQQLTGPAMAKGLEDSSFYRYNRLISLNEVGGHAEATTPSAFHRFVRARAISWPRAMSETSTHDTKRSEDVRARLAGLAEEPRVWDAFVRDLTNAAESHGAPDIDANTRYHLWQAAIGCWPAPNTTMDGYRDRLAAYMQKAVREAAEHTSWTANDDAYESSIADFVTWLMSDPNASAIRTRIDRFVARLDRTTLRRSLAQLTLKLTAPGVPDIYQGQELWDHSFVDPDNRRPVDYAERAAALNAVSPDGVTLRDLMRSPANGHAKMLVTHRLLQLRREMPDLFASASYEPLAARDRSLLAFLRRSGNRPSREAANPQHTPSTSPAAPEKWLVVVVPRLFAAAPSHVNLTLPNEAPRDWRNVLNGGNLRTRDGALPIAKALRAGFPLVVVPA